MWLRDFHVDGLRLDAVHALVDSSDVHLLEELAIEVAALSRPRRPAADPDRRVRPERPGAGHAARGGRLRARRAVERRLPPRGARGADRRDRRATTPTSSRSRRWRRSASAASSTTAPSPRSASATTASPIDTSAMPTWRLVVCHQNHDQVGNRAVGDRITEVLDDDQLAMRRAADPVPGRSRRCCSRARSGPPRRRSSSSPRTRSPSSGRRPPRDGSPSSSRWAGTRRRCPTRRTPRRSPARSWTGRSSAVGRHARAAGGVPPPGRAAPHRCLTLTDPAFSSRLLHGRRGDPGLHDAPWRPARRRELRGCCRRPGGRRGHAALRHAERPVRRDRNAAPPAAHGSSPGAGALLGPDVIRPGRPGDRFV